MSSAGALTKTNIMTTEQAGKVQRGALAWLTLKTYEKSLQFLQAVKFELVTDKECWLRGGGTITVNMLIEFEQQSYNGPDEEIKVYSPDNAFYDLKGIAVQLASILSEYLKSKNHVALIHFTGETKEAMMKDWQESAISWLVFDIGEDPDILEHLNYSTNDGSQLIVGSAFGQELAKLDIIFTEGRCQFNTLALELSKKADEHYGVTLTSDQIEKSGKAIGPPLVKIIRDQSYSYPYSADTKKKLIDMAKYINLVSAKLRDISPLALAGAVADALDDNLSERLPQAYYLAERIAVDYAKRHFQDINLIISYAISAAYSSWLFPVQALGAIGVVVWDLWLTEETKKEIILYFTRNYKKIERFINEPIAQVIAPVRDKHNDTVVELSIKKRVNPAALNEPEAAKLKEDIRSLISRTSNPSQVLCYYACGESKYSGKILQNARTIDQLLKGHNKKPQDRNSAMKWERFYHDFKQG